MAYGLIDIDRIVHTLSMREGELCIGKGGLEAAEYLLVARFMMFSTVYLHRTVRIATAMLYRAMEGAISDGTVSPAFLAEADDEGALAAISRSHKGGPYATALLARKLYKEAASLPRRGWDAQTARKVENALKKKLGCEIIVDYPHGFFKPVGFRVTTDKGLLPIAQVSQLVMSLKKAEEERMRVLVLVDERTKDARAKEIGSALSALRKPRHGR